MREHAADALFTSCICVTELRHGAMRRGDHGAPWHRIEREILVRLEILGLGTDEATRAGDRLAHPSTAGQPIDVEDVLIGATALVRGFTVVTNNVRRFRCIPSLPVEDWTV